MASYIAVSSRGSSASSASTRSPMLPVKVLLKKCLIGEGHQESLIVRVAFLHKRQRCTVNPLLLVPHASAAVDD